MPPTRILLIRLQAMGDVVITLPYARAVKEALPGTAVDFLTRRETSSIPMDVDLFDRVHVLRGGRSTKLQVLHLLALLPVLRSAAYDVVVDLQNNRVSRIITRALRPAAWSRFDRFSARPAGERTRLTIEKAGVRSLGPRFTVTPRDTTRARTLLSAAGWDPACRLVVLNPAGFFPSRNWPLENYVKFANIWLDRYPHRSQFLILGTSRLREPARLLSLKFGDRVIDLVSRTTPAEAFQAVSLAEVMVTEDSGLMHMAWISGVPVVALFGSSRSDWSRPQGPTSLCLDSGDLECGHCMLPVCKYGDNRCLTRYSPEQVARAAFTICEMPRANEKNCDHR